MTLNLKRVSVSRCVEQTVAANLPGAPITPPPTDAYIILTMMIRAAQESEAFF